MKRRTWLTLAAALFAVLALAGIGTAAWASVAGGNTGGSTLASVPEQSKTQDQPFDCSKIEQYGIDKQMNIHAGQILAQCGKAGVANPNPAPAKSAAGSIASRLLSPFA